MAAALSGVFPVCLEQQKACAEENEMKKKQMALMEKLRNKRGSQHRSWTDSLMKSIRTVVDRGLQVDSSERNQVQSCLYTLQRAMKVISQQSLLERLEVVARHQGMMFLASSTDQPSVTLQADMFHIEIILSKGGIVKEVKIAHQGDASVSHELTDILSRGDFTEFTSHLEGLQSIYQITGEKKLKSKVFLALQSLEKDLNDLAQFQSSISGVANYIHKSPLGILLPRMAGKPMKLIYFVSPYDLLDKKTLSAHPMTVEAITEHGLGHSVTVCLESGSTNKLQTMPLLSVTKNLPSFSGLTHANSANLPACFVLVLPQPIPVAAPVLRKIHNLTKLDTAKDTGSQPLLSLILDSNSGGKMKKEQQLYVSLPDQHHCYFINGVSGGLLEEPGVMLSRVPFTHPTHVPKILIRLRQQLLFNSILASCVRPAAKKDASNCVVFEMTVISLTRMTVVFEHPAHDSLVTVDIDLSDITSLRCHVRCTSTDNVLCSDDYASRVLQRCLSLPVLLRSLVLKGHEQLEKMMAEAQALAEEQARRAQEAALWVAAQLRQQQSRLPPSMPSKGRPPPPQPPPLHLTPTYPPTPSPITSIASGMDLLGSPGYPGVAGGDSQDKQNSALLVNFLDSDRGSHASPMAVQQQQQQQQQSGGQSFTESPMLSRLLDDNISVATNVTPISNAPALQPQIKPKATRTRKRRSQSDQASGRSPKHRVNDSDGSERYASLDFESSSSPFESSLGGSGGLTAFHPQVGPTPPRPPSHGHMSGVIDLTEENMPESSLKKLVHFSREGFHQELRPGMSTPDSDLQALLNEQDSDGSPSASLKSNQVTGSKNENASTSLEDFLIGSGEVGKASLPDPGTVHHKPGTPSRSSTSPAATVAAMGTSRSWHYSDCSKVHKLPGAPDSHMETFSRSSPQVIGACGMNGSVSAVHGGAAGSKEETVYSSRSTDICDVKPSVLAGKKACDISASAHSDNAVDKQGLFEKFDFRGQTVSSHRSAGSTSTSATIVEGDNLTAPKVRLKLHPYRIWSGISQSLDAGTLQSPTSARSKSSGSYSFDFCSEEDEDETLPINPVSTSAHCLSVYSASPTRLQISTKGKPSNLPTAPEHLFTAKSEKYKRREKSSGNVKRKKDRHESRKEKKKKFHSDLFRPSQKGQMYRASAIESDQKSGTKLKILVSKEPLITSVSVRESSRGCMDSDKRVKFKEKVNAVLRRRQASSAPMVEKLILQRRSIKNNHLTDSDVDKNENVEEVYCSLKAAGKRSRTKNFSGKTDNIRSSSSLNKVDPKLAKATIRLKPLNIASTSSTSVTLTLPVKGSSVKLGSEPPNHSLPPSTCVSLPTSSTLSLNKLPPCSPSASSVAPLLPVPQILKTSSLACHRDMTSRLSSSKSSRLVTSSWKKSSSSPTGTVTECPAIDRSELENGHNISSSFHSCSVNPNTESGQGTVHNTSHLCLEKSSANVKISGSSHRSSEDVGKDSRHTVVSGSQGMQKGQGGYTRAKSKGPPSLDPVSSPLRTALSHFKVMKSKSDQRIDVLKSIQDKVTKSSLCSKPGSLKDQRNTQKAISSPEQIVPTSSFTQNLGTQKISPHSEVADSSMVTGLHPKLSQKLRIAGRSSLKTGGTMPSSPALEKGRGWASSESADCSLSSSRDAGFCSTDHPSENSSSCELEDSGQTSPNNVQVNSSLETAVQVTSVSLQPACSSPPALHNSKPQTKSDTPLPGNGQHTEGHWISCLHSSRRCSVQTSGNERPSSAPSWNLSAIPDMLQTAGINADFSPNQRPASTPGLVSDSVISSCTVQCFSAHLSQQPSRGTYPDSLSSASRQTISPEQGTTSNWVEIHSSSPGRQGQEGGSTCLGLSPVVSKASSTCADSVALSPQNLPSNISVPDRSPFKVDSNASMCDHTISGCTDAKFLMAAVSQQTLCDSLNASSECQQNSVFDNSSLDVPKQGTSYNSQTAVVSRQNSTSGNEYFSQAAKQEKTTEAGVTPDFVFSSRPAVVPVSTTNSLETAACSGGVAASDDHGSCRRATHSPVAYESLYSGNVTQKSTDDSSNAMENQCAGGSKSSEHKPGSCDGEDVSVRNVHSSTKTMPSAVASCEIAKTDCLCNASGRSSPAVVSVNTSSACQSDNVNTCLSPVSESPSSPSPLTPSPPVSTIPVPLQTATANSQDTANGQDIHPELLEDHSVCTAVVDNLTTKVSISSDCVSDCGERHGSAGILPDVETGPEVVKKSVEGGQLVTVEEAADQLDGEKKLELVSHSSHEQNVLDVDVEPVTCGTTTGTASPADCPTSHAASSTVPQAELGSGSVGKDCSMLLQRDSGQAGGDVGIWKDKHMEPACDESYPCVSHSAGEAILMDSGKLVCPAVGSRWSKFSEGCVRGKESSERDVFTSSTPQTLCMKEIVHNVTISEVGRGLARAGEACHLHDHTVTQQDSPVSEASSPQNEPVPDCADNDTSPSRTARPPFQTTDTLPAPLNTSSSGLKELPSQRIAAVSQGCASQDLVLGKNKSLRTWSLKNLPQSVSYHKLSAALSCLSPTKANSPCDIDEDMMDSTLVGFSAS